jgi:hypothetical protein
MKGSLISHLPDIIDVKLSGVPEMCSFLLISTLALATNLAPVLSKEWGFFFFSISL